VDLFGVRLVGVTAENGQKLLLTLAFVAAVWLLRRGLHGLSRLILGRGRDTRARFWTRQAINLSTTLLLILGVLSVWFDDPARLATALGLVTAGLAFALQRVVTALAGYFVILRGDNFTVGDRITLGGVRGDVIGLGLVQTTIMEMGQPPGEQGAEPAMWVRSRQYTGRVVTVSNDKIFDEPVYNYTRDFPYIWEELTVPITYAADRGRVERILLTTAERHTAGIQEGSRAALAAMRGRYLVHLPGPEPKVYYRLTDNWLELTLRFLAEARGVREIKDAMSREILAALDEAGIGVASATYEIVGLPPLRVATGPPAGRPSDER
jgi:small-conductance mechanosensitive channel